MTAVEKPLLSIGMIVKNEIRCIERCLKALQPLRDAAPCQLVIADTGSTDGTREVAERYADVFFDFPWIDDFAAARNAVLDRCTGTWALVVDADEYMVSPPSALLDFLTSPDSDPYLWGCVDILSYPDPEMKDTPQDSLGLRLARMSNHPRYSGAVHEGFDGVVNTDVILLLDVKFDHDGYRNDSKHPEFMRRKRKRNMEILEQELEARPDNLIRLMQCVESSGTTSKRISYIRRAMKALREQMDTQDGWFTCGPICRCAIEIAAENELPELEEWLQVAREHCRESMFVRLDGSFALIEPAMADEDYEKAVQAVRDYLAAWEDYQAGNFSPSILMVSTLHRITQADEILARIHGAKALALLERTDEAAAMLMGERNWEKLKPGELFMAVKFCGWAAGERELQRYFASQVAEPVRNLSGKEAADMWEALKAAAAAMFCPPEPDQTAPEQPWRLFSKVKGGLGQAVRLMEGDLAEVQAVLPQIQAEDWPDIPAPAVVRAVELGAELPAAFFTQNRERLAELATAVSEGLTLDDLLDWECRWDFTASMTRFQFLFYLLAAALQTDKTWEGELEEDALLDRFLDVAADYLPNYYNPELLSDEAEWAALPGLHRFALHMLQGREARAAGDELGYVRALRAALKAAPAMKKAVAHLMGGMSAAPESELATLAEQVSAILAQYPADDPAMEALKTSPAYQKVARLIEGPEAPVSGEHNQ